jgi:hypothetical protein
MNGGERVPIGKENGERGFGDASRVMGHGVVASIFFLPPATLNL